MKAILDTIPLKEMDASLLTVTLLREAERLGIRDVISAATSYAAYFHQGQTRRNRANFPRTPYIEHPLRNTIRIIRWGYDDVDTLVASIFHDSVEDCAERMRSVAASEGSYSAPSQLYSDRFVAFEWLRTSFGTVATRTVDLVTNPIDMEGDFEYGKHLVTDVLPDPRATIVKASDFMDNPGSLIHQVDADKPERILRLVDKYEPNVPLIEQALIEHGEGGRLPATVARNAASAIHVLGQTLVRVRAIAEEKLA